MRTGLNSRTTRGALGDTAGRGMRTSLGCTVTRIQVAQGESELAHRLAADEPIMAAATHGERRVFSIFKWSVIILLGMVALTLFIPAMVLLDLVLLCVAAVYGTRWMSTRDAIVARIERSRRQAEALSRNRIIAHRHGTLEP